MKTDCYSTTIRSATRTVTGIYDAALKPVGITIAQLALLRRLSAETALSVEDLARSAELERSTATRNVRVLERQGLVSIGKSTTDRREVTLLLTPHGVDIRQQSEPLWEDAQRQFEARVGVDAARALRSLLQAV